MSGLALAPRLSIGDSELAQLAERARAAYPEECCGVLVGELGDPLSVISSHPTPNLESARTRDRYRVDPREALRLGRAAEAVGQAVVGFYHSHPDHAPRPSATDEESAWPGYIYVIIGVNADGRAEIKAWSYDEVGRRFQECPIESEPTTAATGAS